MLRDWGSQMTVRGDSIVSRAPCISVLNEGVIHLTNLGISSFTTNMLSDNLFLTILFLTIVIIYTFIIIRCQQPNPLHH